MLIRYIVPRFSVEEKEEKKEKKKNSTEASKQTKTPTKWQITT